MLALWNVWILIANPESPCNFRMTYAPNSIQHSGQLKGAIDQISIYKHVRLRSVAK